MMFVACVMDFYRAKFSQLSSKYFRASDIDVISANTSGYYRCICLFAISRDHFIFH